MALKFLKTTWQKIAFWAAVVLVAIVLIGAIFVNSYFEPILSKKIKSEVLKSTDSLYHIKFDDAHLHVLQGRIVFYNITVEPDTALYRQRLKQHTAPDNIYSFRVKKLVLKHIHPFKLYFKHMLDIGEIVLAEPEMKISHKPDRQKDTTAKSHLTLYQRISKSLKMIHVGQINLNAVKLRYENNATAKPGISELKELDLGATDLLIDSATQFDKSRFLYCHELTVELNHYHGHSEDNLYHYEARVVKFSTLTRQLSAYNCSFRATGQPFTFFEKTYNDRFFVHLDTLTLNNFDFQLYNERHTFVSSSAELTDGGISVFGNPKQNPATANTERFITFPNKALRMLPFPVRFDTVRVKNIDVGYQEFNKKTKRIGHIDFNHTRGFFYNITNDPAVLKKNNRCRVLLKSRFMSQANIDVYFNFNLTDSLGSFYYRGTMGPMNMPAVNVASIPLASVAIKSGQLKRLSFDISANRNLSTGTVEVLYNNLKIQLLKADTAKEKMKHMPLATLFANALIIKHNNPDDDHTAPRVSHVVYKRPFNYPFFKTLWNTLFMGIKPCAGVDQQTQQRAQDEISQHQKDKILKKQRKAERKERRKEKRLRKKIEKELKKEEEKDSKRDGTE